MQLSPHLISQFKQAKPFPHLALPNFLPLNQFTTLLLSLQNESYKKLSADLFEFLQTNDLKTSTCKSIQKFQKTIQTPKFISFLESCINKKISKTKLDLFASIYKKTHYLLPHDDQLEGRAIAYIYYLTDLKKQDGGALALFNSTNKQPTSINKRIQPTQNTFLFFEVSQKSFHQVQEVLTNTQRIALTGWFYYG